MFKEGLENAANAAAGKIDRLKNGLGGYIILSLLAGFYIGSAMFISCVIASRSIDSPDKFLMGLGFSVGLIFVVFAGAELFTGNVLTMALAALSRKVNMKAVLAILIVSFIGNLIGGWLTALLAQYSGLCSGAVYDYMLKAANAKTSLPFIQMFTRAVLCNMFVTLGIWMSSRVKAEGAKIALLVAAVFAFIVSGYEHVVANAFLIPAAWLVSIGEMNGGDMKGIADYFVNMGVVGLGNLVGGLIVAFSYHFAGNEKTAL